MESFLGIVIVIDLSNYKAEYAEKLPFRAKILDTYLPNVLLVQSLETGKEYEIYQNQILEGLDIEEIKAIVNLN